MLAAELKDDESYVLYRLSICIESSSCTAEQVQKAPRAQAQAQAQVE